LFYGRYHNETFWKPKPEALHTLSLCLALSCLSDAAWGTVYYVDDDPPCGNGSSWADAFCDLQDALAIAASGDEIWVAAGVYKPIDCAPSCGEGDRDATFHLKDGVEIYGGFAGCETNLSQRDLAQHESILSGDLLGDDGPNFTFRGDNVYNVVTSCGNNPFTVLDGFTIRGGYDANSFTQFAGCAGTSEPGGGGVRLDLGGSPTIRNCNILDNYAENGGGGIYIFGSSDAHIVNCAIAGNKALTHGGGIGAKSFGNMRIFNCRIVGNQTGGITGGTGAGLHMESGTNPWIVNCLIARNTIVASGGGEGAGLWITGDQSLNLWIKDTTIADNAIQVNPPNPSSFGGGVYVRDTSIGIGLRILLDNTIIWGNNALEGRQIYTWITSNARLDARYSNVKQDPGDIFDPGPVNVFF
jgi:parallel beta-helix repeat protein